jgi:hypothetical protein
MVYRKGNTGQDLASMMADIFQTVAPDAGPIVQHPHFRLLIPVTQLRAWTLRCPAWLMYALCYMLLVRPTPYPHTVISANSDCSSTAHVTAARHTMAVLGTGLHVGPRVLYITSHVNTLYRRS